MDGGHHRPLALFSLKFRDKLHANKTVHSKKHVVAQYVLFITTKVRTSVEAAEDCEVSSTGETDESGRCANVSLRMKRSLVVVVAQVGSINHQLILPAKMLLRLAISTCFSSPC